jgi:hypothetical protein
MHVVDNRILSALAPSASAVGLEPTTGVAANVRNELRRAEAFAATAPTIVKDKRVRIFVLSIAVQGQFNTGNALSHSPDACRGPLPLCAGGHCQPRATAGVAVNMSTRCCRRKPLWLRRWSLSTTSECASLFERDYAINRGYPEGLWGGLMLPEYKVQGTFQTSYIKPSAMYTAVAYGDKCPRTRWYSGQCMSIGSCWKGWVIKHSGSPGSFVHAKIVL